MNQPLKIDDASLIKPMLIVGKLEDFDTEIQALIGRYEYQVLDDFPEARLPTKYSVIIFSPGCHCKKLATQSERNFFC